MMIVRLRGDLIEAENGRMVIEAGGVGYEVFVPGSTFVQLPPLGDRVDLQIRQVFREDGTQLYGFYDKSEKRLFDLLIEVKGCGPKTALALIGELGFEVVLNGIAAQDVKLLSRASGVGPRLAERIIVELKDKAGHEILTNKLPLIIQNGNAVVEIPNDELVDALLALGYKRGDAELAAQEAKRNAQSLEDQIKLAIRSLRR